LTNAQNIHREILDVIAVVRFLDHLSLLPATSSSRTDEKMG